MSLRCSHRLFGHHTISIVPFRALTIHLPDASQVGRTSLVATYNMLKPVNSWCLPQNSAVFFKKSPETARVTLELCGQSVSLTLTFQYSVQKARSE